MTSETTSMYWANAEPYAPIENNPRVSDWEVVWCKVCHDEAVVISNDGKWGLCSDHYEMLLEACDD